MTTIRYARYVVVNEQTGSIAWYENKKRAQRAADSDIDNTLYDYDTDEPETIEKALANARKNMGVE